MIIIKGEILNIGTSLNVEFVGIGRTFEEKKYLIFKKSEGGFLLVSKDVFYSNTFHRERINNANP